MGDFMDWMDEPSDEFPLDDEPQREVRLCVCGCGRVLEGNQKMYARPACKFRTYRQAERENREGKNLPAQLTAVTTVPPGAFVPKHGYGLLMRGNTKGLRPTKQLRHRMRGVTEQLLDELERRVQYAQRPYPPKEELERMPKDRLIEMLLEGDGFMALSANELRQCLDTAAKYGLGVKQVHSGDEEDAPIQSGIIILPPLNPD